MQKKQSVGPFHHTHFSVSRDIPVRQRAIQIHRDLSRRLPPGDSRAEGRLDTTHTLLDVDGAHGAAKTGTVAEAGEDPTYYFSSTPRDLRVQKKQSVGIFQYLLEKKAAVLEHTQVDVVVVSRGTTVVQVGGQRAHVP